MHYQKPPNEGKLCSQIRKIMSARDKIEPKRADQQIINLVLTQFLPENCIMIGGASLQLKYGAQTRFTADFDTGITADEKSFITNLEFNLSKGWQGFTGYIEPEKSHSPNIRGLKDGIQILSLDVRIHYNGKPFGRVKVEATRQNISKLDYTELKLDNEGKKVLDELGFKDFTNPNIVVAELQVAQKLHRLSRKGQDEIKLRDLIDIISIERHEVLERNKLIKYLERTFAQYGQDFSLSDYSHVENYEHQYNNIASTLPNTLPFDQALEFLNQRIKVLKMSDEEFSNYLTSSNAKTQLNILDNPKNYVQSHTRVINGKSVEIKAHYRELKQNASGAHPNGSKCTTTVRKCRYS